MNKRLLLFFLSFCYLFALFPVIRNTHACPDTEGTKECVDLLISEQESYLITAHFGIPKIVLGEKLPRTVQLFLKGCVLLQQLSL